ncbi:MAG: CBS domain-containing protein [Nitrospira sp.]|nr:CBS domain-containing protein [Nitrospira sp.]
MAKTKTVKEVMIDVFEYPHVPYWFTIGQAMEIIRKSLMTGDKCYYPMAVLVFDEKYNLMGSVTIGDILKGLEPKLKISTLADAEISYVDEDVMTSYETSLFNAESKKNVEKPVGDIMVPAKTFVAPEDSVVKAAIMMIHHNVSLLPVLEDKKKLVGLVKMVNVFDEIANMIL